MAGGGLAGLACGVLEAHVPGASHAVVAAAPLGMTVLGGSLGPAPDVDTTWNMVKVRGRRVWVHHKSIWLQHRGPTHSIWAALIVAATLGLAVADVHQAPPGLALTVAATAFCAWGSHILLDLFTKMPVYVFFPKKIANPWGWPEHTIREQTAEYALIVASIMVVVSVLGHGQFPPHTGVMP